MMWLKRLICRITDHDMRSHTVDTWGTIEGDFLVVYYRCHRCHFTRRVVRQITRNYMPVLAHFVIPNRRIC